MQLPAALDRRRQPHRGLCVWCHHHHHPKRTPHAHVSSSNSKAPSRARSVLSSTRTSTTELTLAGQPRHSRARHGRWTHDSGLRQPVERVRHQQVGQAVRRSRPGCCWMPQPASRPSAWLHVAHDDWGNSVRMKGRPGRVRCSKAHIDRSGCQRKDEPKETFQGHYDAVHNGPAPDGYIPNLLFAGLVVRRGRLSTLLVIVITVTEGDADASIS